MAPSRAACGLRPSIEYLIVSLDGAKGIAKLSLRSSDILSLAAQDSASRADGNFPSFQTEFCSFNLESTPGKPWTMDPADLLDVGLNMKWRRALLKKHMKHNEYPITLTNFPRFGLTGSTTPEYPPSGPQLESQFISDETTTQRTRYISTAKNIRARRGRKVQINVPVFRDEKTPWPFHDPSVDCNLRGFPEDNEPHEDTAKTNHIYMDAQPFGSGTCCLQVTLQASNIDEARKLYDRLIPLAPIMLALTAATPIYKGFLADTDARWNTLVSASDDRTEEEIEEKILSPRFGGNTSYISPDPRLRVQHNNHSMPIPLEIKQKLIAEGMDDLLASHFARILIRDPLILCAEDLSQPDLTTSNLFEMFQGLNWQPLRFKPPPPRNIHDIGWRVEFRSMEVQPTDFENAAFAVFVILLTRAVLAFDVDFYMPISMVEENMETAQGRDAVNRREFYFSANWMTDDADEVPLGGSADNPCIAPSTIPPRTAHNSSTNANGPLASSESAKSTPDCPYSSPTGDHATYPPTPMSTLVNGPPSRAPNILAPGLLPLVKRYLATLPTTMLTPDQRAGLEPYLDLVSRRASGLDVTPATRIREVVRQSEGYMGDSRVGEEAEWRVVNEVGIGDSGMGLGNSDSIAASR
ncbi:MAG: hypothetical protein Q9194_001532 [Teloschistes cf. exilis]